MRKLLLLVVVLSLLMITVTVFAEEGNYDKKFTYTVSMMNIDAVEADLRFEYLKEKFNVDFEFRPVNWNNWDEKIRIWTASGDMPDIMWTDLQNKFSEYVNWASQGAYKPLPDNLGDKYPNLQAQLDSLQSDKYWRVNGKLYAIPVTMGTVEWRDPLVSTYSFIYRVDWAKEVGLYQEDGDYTWEEMVGMAKAFIEQDPGNNGTGKTIGIAGIGWAWPWFAGLRQTHQLNDPFALKDGEYVWTPAQVEFLEGIKEVKRLYDTGILWEDQPIANNDAAKNKFIAGELGIYYDNINVNDYYTILRSLQDADREFDLADVEPMFVASPKGNFYADVILDHWSATLYNPKMSDGKFARWLEIADYMATDEGYRLGSYGIKSKDYMLDEEGNVELLWEKDEDGNFINPYDVDAVRFFELITMHDEFILNNPALPEKIKDDVKNIMRRKLEDDYDLVPFSYETTWFNGPAYTSYFGRLGDTNAKISELVVSTRSMEELEEEWKKYIKSKESTVKRILEELNRELLNK